ncbi:MAG TPA: DNA polymerase III subunit alpha [Sedimentisphaerales bacterium]|nr:DNA polymerase III subunit alpha [Sedimentisphaerales bacterium]
MSNKGFIHLHLHTQYSLLDGAIPFEPLFARCKKLGMDSVAMTDHGNMFGAVEFYIKARAAGIKPIIGIEAYIAPGSRHDKSKSSISDAAYHLVLLAENNAGYQNLLKLASIGYTEGFYYRPRIDKEVLAQFSEGLICSTACIKGEVTAAVASGDMKAARAAAESYLKIFGPERFFIEIQCHKDEDPNVRAGCIELANEMGIGLVATNDVHFLEADDYEAHNCLTCISTGKLATDPERMVYPPGVYLKSSDEMREMFPEAPESCDNTLAIAARCNVEIDLKTRHAPVYRPPDGSTAEDYLRKLCYEGAKERYGEITDRVTERMERELQVIQSKGFSSYFLIVWDFCNYSRSNGIPVGARGSGVGTIVGYCLGLCDVDPIKYDLLFERFMDPARNEMPDIDIDICQQHRPDVIDYVRKKYGEVAQIITFGTMKAKAVIRDICRVLGVPLAEADRLAKLVPFSLDMTLDKALETEPELKTAYDTNDLIRKVIDIGRKLEGLTRHASVHAAGVVIADEPLTNFVPLYKASGTDDVITQYEGPMVEKCGLLKMDFLGLKTLSVLSRACQLVKNNHGVVLDLEKIDITDPKVFEIFVKGRTKGIFQFESGGMQDLVMKMRPDRIEDLIAANALYRPGPMTLIPDYIDRKHGAEWTCPHEIMTEVLRETYGIMVYQEQVMRICNRLGDIPLREAYGLIKAISKKKIDIIGKEKERFLAGSVAKGLKKSEAEHIFELIERFAGYGFNKSHSTRYAFVAYQTAFLKAYYPVEFMAALLTYDKGDTEKVVEYIGECREMGIEVMAPDVNDSDVDFTPLYKEAGQGVKGVIRFGLAAVRGVGEKAVEQMIAARKKVGGFRSLFHFCENVDLRAVNKQVIEALIKGGAFDRLGGNRNQMMMGLERAMQVGSSLQSDKVRGQMNFFGQISDEKQYAEDHKALPDVPPWPELQMLAFEKQVLGFYVTNNPLSQHAEMINDYSTTNTARLAQEHGPAEGNGGNGHGNGNGEKQVTIGGMITKVRYNVTKNGRNAGAKMAVFTLEDLQGQIEVVLFPDTLAECASLLVEDSVVFVKGKTDCRRERANILASELIPLEKAREKLAKGVWIKLDAQGITADKVQQIRNVCQSHRGNRPLSMIILTNRGRIHATADRALCVNPDVEFCRKMRQLVGDENFQLAR